MPCSASAGSPVLACVTTGDPYTTHWVVVYGYGRRPNLLFVAGQGLHFFAQQRVKWPDFRRQWSPTGHGIVCWKAKTRKNARPSRSVKKK